MTMPCGLLGGEAGAQREAAADALGRGHDVGLDAIMLIGVERAGPRDAALHLVEDQHQVVLVAGLAQALMNSWLAGRMPPSPWTGSTRKPAVFSSIAASAASRSSNSTTLKPGSSGAKPSRIFAWLVALIVAIVRPWKALLKVISVVLVGIAVDVMVAARGLDRALDRLGAGIGEEHRVGEGQVDQPLGQRLALRRAVEVGDVHQRRRLLLDRLGQVRVAVAEQVDRDARGEVEIFLAVLAIEVGAFAAHRPDVATRINGHERRDGHGRDFPSAV